MEFLIVKFQEDREVLINDRVQGSTNKVLELDKGKYKVSIKAPPDNFIPKQITILLQNTTVISPMEVDFEKEGN